MAVLYARSFAHLSALVSQFSMFLWPSSNPCSLDCAVADAGLAHHGYLSGRRGTFKAFIDAVQHKGRKKTVATENL